MKVFFWGKIIVIKQLKIFLLIVLPLPAVADFSIDSPLSFGEIAITSNNTVSTLSVSRGGAALSTGSIYIIHPGSPGVFTFSGIAPFTVASLSVDLPAFSTMGYPNTAQFEMSSVDIPSSINLGPTGSAQFKMGGTMRTSGNPAKSYYSGVDYVIYLNLNITY
jgi:hypothetical protein